MTKKSKSSICGAIILIVALTTTYATAQPTTNNSQCQGKTSPTNGCPKFWVEVTPAFFQQSPADHTYVKFLKEDGQWQSFPCFGACNGGNELPETKTSTWQDNIKIIQYMADSMPCKWPKHYYLIIGVCHQLANRGLFHTGKIVKKARFYNWSSFVYQTYGHCFWPLKEYCMGNCQEASEELGAWHKGAPPSCLQTGGENAKPEKPDAEYNLYVKHFSKLSAPKDDKDLEDQLKSYRKKLLILYINQRLGNKYQNKYQPILSKEQENLLKKKRELDFQLFKDKSFSDNRIDAYNKIFNESLDNLRAEMPKALFEQFFGLSYEKKMPIDMRYFLPKE